MKKLLFPLALCLALSACSAPAETREPPEAPALTAEEARETLAQALLKRNPGFLSYDPETDFAAEGLHFVWSDVFWNEAVPTAAAGDTEIYCFDLVFGPGAGAGLEDVGNPMAGRLCASYGVGKDGISLWQYRQDLGEWEALFENGNDNGKES